MIKVRPKGKLRTAEQILGEVGYNFVVRKILKVGYATNLLPDYGCDGVIITTNAHGVVDSGAVSFQLKSRSHFQRVEQLDETYALLSFKDADVEYFLGFTSPFYIIAYDGAYEEAYWCEAGSMRLAPGSKAGSVSKRYMVPTANVLGPQALVEWREAKFALTRAIP